MICVSSLLRDNNVHQYLFTYEQKFNHHRFVGTAKEEDSTGKTFNSGELNITHALLAVMERQVNTTPSLFWTLFHVLNDPEICLEVESEIRTLFKAKRGAEAEEDQDNHLLDDILSLEKKDVDQLVVIVEH